MAVCGHRRGYVVVFFSFFVFFLFLFFFVFFFFFSLDKKGWVMTHGWEGFVLLIFHKLFAYFETKQIFSKSHKNQIR